MMAIENSNSKPLEMAQLAIQRILVRAGVFSLFVNILMLTGPLYMLQIYDRVLSSRSFETLIVLTILTLALFAAMGALDFVRSALLARAGAMFENRLRQATFNSSMEAAVAAGKTPGRPLQDLRQIRQFIGSPALTAFFDAPMTPVFLLMVYLMHWLLGIVATVGLLILLALALINERWSRPANEAAQRMTAQTDELATATLRNATAADAMGMRGGLRKKWMLSGDAAIGEALRANSRITALTAASKATRLFLQSAILGTGAVLAIQQQVTPGVMIAASIITGRALAPVEIVTSQWRNYAMALFAFERLKKFLSTLEPEPSKTRLPPPVGRLSLQKVYVQPALAEKPIVRNISFSLSPGEVLGVIGPSAAGKSTLARAIVGVERVVSGEIRIDDAALYQWERDYIGKYVGYLPQDIELFAGTVAENITRFAQDAGSEDVIAAAHAAAAHDLILSLPDGYETDIGEFGRKLSSGQRQRIGLARALYNNPVLVVLDEPNSSLDAEGDAALARAIQGLKKRGATTIIIAHRPSAIAFADKLLMLVEGEARAFGPRDEVLRKIAPGLIASQQDLQKQQVENKTGNASLS